MFPTPATRLARSFPTPPSSCSTCALPETVSADRRSERSTAANNAGPAVEVVGLTVVRERIPVLCSISLALRCGEILAVAGPNGAGKSTLLSCFAGAVHPATGEIRWWGRPARSPIVRRQIGFVGHEFGAYHELTVMENFVFAGRMCGVARPEARASELLTDAGLEWTADHRFGNLSQGLKRRVAIMRALIHDPTLILLDEPFAGLDTEGRCWLERLFQLWQRQSQTVCFVSHDERDAHMLADSTVWLRHGRVEKLQRSDSNRSFAVRIA
jgi:ABC-type multidrug transport system ATPase subunit